MGDGASAGPADASGITFHRSALAAMDPTTLYRLLTLRVAVFVVEQRAAYPDLDGRDDEPGAELLWAEESRAPLDGSAERRALVDGSVERRVPVDGAADRDPGPEVLATVRILAEPDAMRIGRVATAASARSRGVASALMRQAVERCVERAPELPIDLGGQEHLAPWYERFGFRVSGPRYFEDDIPHLPMRRAAGLPVARG